VLFRSDLTVKVSTHDAARRITTDVDQLDAHAFTRLVSRLADIPEHVVDTLALRDLPLVRSVVARMIGAEPDVIREAADALVFDLEWAPDTVERMTVPHLGYWLKRAIAHRKRQST
jgi:hypothetical protein